MILTTKENEMSNENTELNNTSTCRPNASHAIKAQCYLQQALIDSLDGILEDCGFCRLDLYSKDLVKHYEALRDIAVNNIRFLEEHKQDVIEMLEAK